MGLFIASQSGFQCFTSQEKLLVHVKATFVGKFIQKCDTSRVKLRELTLAFVNNMSLNPLCNILD